MSLPASLCCSAVASLWSQRLDCVGSAVFTGTRLMGHILDFANWLSVKEKVVCALVSSISVSGMESNALRVT